MSTMSRLTLLAFLSVSVITGAQVTSQPPTTGMQEFGSFASSPDVINLGNLNVHLVIPLLHKPGRGVDFNYSLVYDSSVWNGASTSGSGNWSPVNKGMWGWQYDLDDKLTETGHYFDGVTTCYNAGFNSEYAYNYSNYSVKTPDGVTHSFSGSAHYSQCTGEGSGFTAESSDGYQLVVSEEGSAILTYPNGLSSSLIGVDGTLIGGTVGTPLTDTNGNFIQVGIGANGPYKDTLGMTPITASSTQTVGLTTAIPAITSPNAFQYTDSNGTTQTISLTYSSFTVQTNYGISGISDYGPVASVNLLTKVAYPDGTYYAFTYEPTPGYSSNTTGRIQSITLPGGGTITYAYTGSNNGIYSDGSTAGFTRTTADGTTTYSRSGVSGSSGNGSSTTTVTTADSIHSQTVINFMEANYDFYETSRKVYSGSSGSGTQERTITTCYYTGTTTISNCSGGSPALPFGEIDVSQKLDNNQTSKTVTKYNANQLPTEFDSYDYSSGSPASLLSQTLTVYSSALGNNILNRPQTVTTYDGSGNAVSQTSYSYDGGTLQPSTPASPPGELSWTGSRGNVTEVQQWINTSNCGINIYTSGCTLNRSMVYDTSGQLVQSIDPSGNTTTIAYDTTYDAYPVSVTPPTPSSGVVLSASAGYDFNTGLMLWLKDANTQETSFTYDDMLRLAQTINPDGAVIHSTYEGATQAGVSVSPGGTAPNVDTENFYDGYGRLIRVATANGQTSYPYYIQDVCYDADGRTAFESLPYQAASYTGSEVCSSTGDTYAYDGISRVSSVRHADGTSVTYGYTGRATSVTDEGNGTTSAQTISQHDGLGRLSAVCEVGPTVLASASGNATACALDYTTGSPSGYSTTYAYSLSGHTTTTTQGVQMRVFTSDSLGRTVKLQEPEVTSGTTQGYTTFSYAYPSTGLTVTRTKPTANQTSESVTTTTTTQFDQVGRPISITYSDSTPGVTYTYDTGGPTCSSGNQNPKGRLVVQATSGNTSKDSYCYDVDGRITWESSCTSANCSGTPYTQSFTYDLADNLIGMTDAAGTSYTYTVSAASELTKIVSSLNDANHPSTLLNTTSIGPQGPIQATLGNGIVSAYSYDTQQRLTGETLTKGSLLYSYSSTLAGNGAVKTEQNAAANWTYGYDANNRLSSSNVNSGTQTFSYVYDRWGNRWQQNAPQGGPAPSLTFNTATNQLQESGYTYDAAGERRSDPTPHTYTYDAEGRVIKVDSSTATYVYDADGNRVESTTSAGTTDWVYNLDGQATVIVNATTQTPVRANTWWGGSKLSFYTYGTSPTTYFVEQTPLGTVSGLTSVGGSIYSYSTSYPFGDGVTWYGSTDPDTLFYAGLDHDSETNTEHAWARQYSSTEGLWTVPDPYTGSYDPNNPQTFNRYAYVLNNPLMFVDPSGLDEGDGGDPGGDPSSNPDGNPEGDMPGGDGSFNPDDIIQAQDPNITSGQGRTLNTGDPNPNPDPTPPPDGGGGDGFGGLGGPGGASHGPSGPFIVLPHLLIPSNKGNTTGVNIAFSSWTMTAFAYAGSGYGMMRGRSSSPGERNWAGKNPNAKKGGVKPRYDGHGKLIGVKVKDQNGKDQDKSLDWAKGNNVDISKWMTGAAIGVGVGTAAANVTTDTLILWLSALALL